MKRFKRWLRKRLGLWTVASITAPLGAMRQECLDLAQEKEAENEALRDAINRNASEMIAADLVARGLNELFGWTEKTYD